MKNLADTIITEEKMAPKSNLNSNIGVKTNEEDMNIGPDYSPLAGITSFFSGVMNVITSAMFSKRKQSDFVAQPSGEMAVPSMWHGAKILDENKILQDGNRSNEKSSELLASEMTDVKKAAAHCQNKIEQVRLLLGSKPVPCNLRTRRCPKRIFVEASSVEDSFEDAFSPEDFESIANDSFIEYSSPVCYHDHIFHEVDGPKVKTDTAKTTQNIPDVPTLCETTEIVKNVPEIETTNENKLVCDTKPEVVATCEDKLSKLKALLQNRRKKSKLIAEPEPVIVPELPKPKTKVKDKRFKNPNRTCGKRMKSKMRKNIQDDLQFANEIIIEDASSVENSPSMGCLEKFITATKPEKFITATKPEKEYFDEVSGRFLPGSVTESEDSFQIVFNDCPKLRRTSDCESEDSFIVFEDSPDSCYTSNDVFGETSDSEDYDSDSDMSDSGCGYSSFNLAASLSKSVCNLADDSLYAEHSEDEVDCANVNYGTVCESVNLDMEPAGEKTGLLIDDRKKLLRRGLPAKKVHFSEAPPKVHVMRVWSFAARQARAGHWERYAIDRERFKRRIADVDVAVSWVLKPQHRSRVMFQRFMPWWNAQKRKELAEKKEKEAQDKIRREEEASRAKQEEEGDLVSSEQEGDSKESFNTTEEKNSESKIVANGELFKNYDYETESKKISIKDDVTKTEIIPLNDKVFDLKSDFVKQAVLDT